MLRRLILMISCFAVLLTAIASIAAPKESKPISPAEKKQTICLNMIVKNENSIITKCLSSVKGLIDYWVIVDTGSWDGTQETIKNYLKDIPGTLYERPWVDFAHNRNEALSLAKTKADYTLFIDADEMLLFADNFTKPILDKDVYYIPVQQTGSSRYLRWFLVNNKRDWHWEGVLHEQLLCSNPCSQAIIEGVVNASDTSLGARSRNPQKYLDDAAVLLKGLEKEPNNSRYQFYLAQSYANAGELCQALAAYEKRVAMGGGFQEEVFVSLYLISRIQEILNVPSPIVSRKYLTAHAHTPSRPEPLYYLGAHYARMQRLEDAYRVLSKGAATALSNSDTLFVETEISSWRTHALLAEVCWKLNKIEEMVHSCEKVALCEGAPNPIREEMQKNVNIIRQNKATVNK